MINYNKELVRERRQLTLEGTAPFLVLARRPLVIGDIIKSVGLVYLQQRITTFKFTTLHIGHQKLTLLSHYLSWYLNALGTFSRFGVPFLGNAMPPLCLASPATFGLFGTFNRSIIKPFTGTKILCFSSVFSSGVGVLHSHFELSFWFSPFPFFSRSGVPSMGVSSSGVAVVSPAPEVSDCCSESTGFDWVGVVGMVGSVAISMGTDELRGITDNRKGMKKKSEDSVEIWAMRKWIRWELFNGKTEKWTLGKMGRKR